MSTNITAFCFLYDSHYFGAKMDPQHRFYSISSFFSKVIIKVLAILHTPVTNIHGREASDHLGSIMFHSWDKQRRQHPRKTRQSCGKSKSISFIHWNGPVLKANQLIGLWLWSFIRLMCLLSTVSPVQVPDLLPSHQFNSSCLLGTRSCHLMEFTFAFPSVCTPITLSQSHPSEINSNCCQCCGHGCSSYWTRVCSENTFFWQ